MSIPITPNGSRSIQKFDKALWHFRLRETYRGERIRFQGRQVDQCVWYVHVSLERYGQSNAPRWSRFSYGYQFGGSLSECADSFMAMLEEVYGDQSIADVIHSTRIPANFGASRSAEVIS